MNRHFGVGKNAAGTGVETAKISPHLVKAKVHATHELAEDLPFKTDSEMGSKIIGWENYHGVEKQHKRLEQQTMILKSLIIR